MNILVLNGSPKSDYSITLHTALYLQKKHLEHHFEIFHVGAKIKALERDMTPVLTAIEQADVLLFSYPVYTFIASSQLHRFFELLKASGVDLRGKYASQITTSKHFYDITAHRYVQDNCQDMGMKVVKGLSADMDDLPTEKGQQEAMAFFDYLMWSVTGDHYEPLPEPAPAPKHLPVTVPSSVGEKPGDVVILTDAPDAQLQAMIDRFRAVFPRSTRVIDLQAVSMKGGCLGCFRCAADGTCVYRDGFDRYLREEIQTADSIVYAFTIRDHSMGARFKMYDDRQFCNGHRTVTMGMPMGYLISGDYSREFNLQTIVEGRAQVGGNFLAGVATDEQDPDGSIDRLAATLAYALDTKLTQPSNFYGVGGMKIFRDLIWLMQGLMRADHKFYKAHGQYDFPQKQRPKMWAMYAVGAMMGSEKLRAKMGDQLNEGMVMSHKKAVEKA